MMVRLLGAMLVLVGAAMAVEPGVSRELAVARAARISDVRYELGYEIKEHAETTAGHEALEFNDSGTGELAVDFRDGVIASAKLNGTAIGTGLENGHLMLPAAGLVRGANKLEVYFTASIGAAGKAITRYEDKDDGSEYFYTLFVPMDASMAFPCFDQPDLKARFTLITTVPKSWTVISNGLERASMATSSTWSRVRFNESQPISTYLFAFAAGPFARIEPGGAGQPALYVRKSQLARAKVEAPQVQAMAGRGVGYLADYFQQPFPFFKYDLVLIPGFPFGGMEHAGATFLNEDGVLFRTAPTQADYFRRDILVLHETCHQWFGDLVTMRWFDDLWLKEGFAQYLAYKAMAVLEPKTEPWKHFYEDIKPLAYGIDETQGTTPIFQVIPNLKDAKSAYGAIVYQKAPAVLKQLNFRLGEDVFRSGLRLYLKQHAYGNAQWADLIGAFTQAGGKDVQAWADAWILRRGMPEVTTQFTCEGDRLKTLEMSQKDVLGTASVWPIANAIYLGYAKPQPAGKPFDLPRYDIEPIRVSWNVASLVVTPSHAACPAFVFANYDDQAYGRFLLDPKSERYLAGPKTDESTWMSPEPFLNTMLWGALWENVRIGRMAPIEYAQLVRPALFVENDESLSRIQGARVGTLLHSYLGPKAKAEVRDRLENTVMSKMSRFSTVGIRIVNFRTFVSIAETEHARGVLKSLLSGETTVEGMPLKLQDRWNIIARLTALADPDAEELAGRERARDRSGEALKYAYAAGAGVPDLRVKARYFEQYLNDKTVQEDWLTQSLRPFNSWNQTALTLPFLGRALDALPDIKAHRKIFFLGAWLGAFVGGQDSVEAQGIVHAWLARKGIDPDLRLKVLEASDELDRTVMIRQRYLE